MEKQKLIDRARAFLQEYMLRRGTRTPREGEPPSAYDLLDAAVREALAGDASAVPTLRRVFDEPGFAITNSLHEQGLAALALALLGDRESIPRIRRGRPINLNREAIPLALAILEGG
jgi:hypothetical protein